MRQFFAAAIAASVIATAASAEPFPPPNSADPRSASNPVEDTYQESGTANCNTGACEITFPATTHSKTLVSHVSCFFQISSSATVFAVQLAATTGAASNFVGIEKYDSFSGFGSYVANAPTYLFYAQGEHPTITVVSTGSFVSSFNCTISGNYH